jgi:hypothetical protein
MMNTHLTGPPGDNDDLHRPLHSGPLCCVAGHMTCIFTSRAIKPGAAAIYAHHHNDDQDH